MNRPWNVTVYNGGTTAEAGEFATPTEAKEHADALVPLHGNVRITRNGHVIWKAHGTRWDGSSWDAYFSETVTL